MYLIILYYVMQQKMKLVGYYVLQKEAAEK